MKAGALRDHPRETGDGPCSRAHSRPNENFIAAMSRSAGTQREMASGAMRCEVLPTATTGKVLRSVSSSLASAILRWMEWGWE